MSETENKEIKINLTDLKNYDVLKVPVLEGEQNWSENSPQTQEYINLVSELEILAKYMAMRISTGPEVKDSILKRCATLNVILDTLVTNVAISGWDLYGVTGELWLNMYMSMSGKIKTVQLLRAIHNQNQKLAREKMGSAIV